MVWYLSMAMKVKKSEFSLSITSFDRRKSRPHFCQSLLLRFWRRLNFFWRTG
ncbi:hypothetical protein SAY86_009066 [Trapa natans]|uniref:Uncharacterized protein n=1 Tax=Trapa natans TaxID=22666 RepID=A0AAN7KF63_TRANT|nr:hypothetical protein SAY86_009066 [Trapa natans]